MAKKILINVEERVIFGEVFPNERLAHNQMEKELCEKMEWEDDELEENLQIAYENTSYDFGISKLSAWANADDGDKNCDWAIFDFSKPFALVSVIDREISFEEFDTIEEARERMFEEFKKCPDWSDWKNEFKIDIETNDYGFHKNNAWANSDDGDRDCDWVIVQASELD